MIQERKKVGDFLPRIVFLYYFCSINDKNGMKT